MSQVVHLGLCWGPPLLRPQNIKEEATGLLPWQPALGVVTLGHAWLSYQLRYFDIFPILLG